MNNKFKLTSAILSASLLVTPISGIINQNDNVAKAEEIKFNLKNNFNNNLNIDNNIKPMYDGWANNNGAINVITMDYNECIKYIKYYNMGTIADSIAKGVLTSFIPLKGILSRIGVSTLSALSTRNQSDIYKACLKATQNKKNYLMIYVYMETGNYNQYWFKYSTRIIYG